MTYPGKEDQQVPFIEVKLFDYRLTDGVADKIIAAVTDGLCAACGEEVRDRTEVVVQGIPPQLWGFGGRTITRDGAAS
jgi:phenylpyruvate tautomerase PptA (4-oxalocrotonate tautomerase family)